jgi:anti-sigma factor RsiW
MDMDLENGLPLKSYLLGELGPDERHRLEQRLMTESEAFEELHRIEEELIDDYLEGGLSGRDRERFENFFLAAPERKQKLSFAKSLKRYLAAHKSEAGRQGHESNSRHAFLPLRNRALKWAFAASLLFMVAGGSWSVLQISSLRTALDLERTETRASQERLKSAQIQNRDLTVSLENEQSRVRQMEQQVAELKNNQKQGPSLLPGQDLATTIAITLTPLLRDVNGNPRKSIPAGTTLVRFDVKMEPRDYRQYQATLQRVGGNKIMTQTSSSIQGLFSGMIVPAELLTPEDYVLTLTGITAAGDMEDTRSYYFRIIPE